MSYDIDVYISRPPIRAVLAAIDQAGGPFLQIETPVNAVTHISSLGQALVTACTPPGVITL